MVTLRGVKFIDLSGSTRTGFPYTTVYKTTSL